MNKSLKVYLILLFVLLIGAVVLESNKPKVINWEPTYSINDKIPFGLYIFDKELPSLLNPDTLYTINTTAYEYFDPLYDFDTLVNKYSTSGTFLAINNLGNFDDESLKELLYFSSHGNTVFLSMNNVPKMLKDSLKFEIEPNFTAPDSTILTFTNQKWRSEKYNLSEGLGYNYFSKIDTATTTVLGYQIHTDSLVNFINIPYKQGNFIIHLQPSAFTNFHLLKDKNYEYAEKVLSYIPKGNIFWYTKDISEGYISQNPLRFIFSQPALKAAWYLFIGGFVVFIIFNVKRKQRIIPIITPLENTTVEFTKTIGNLYFQEGNHHTIIDKKIIYLLDKIRREYLLDTSVLDDKFIHKLQLKTGASPDVLQKLFYKVNQHRKGNFVSVESDLIEINALIEKVFKTK